MFLQKKIGFIFIFFFFLMPLQIICAQDLAWLTDAAARVQEWKTTSENKAKKLKTHLSRDKLIEAEDKYMVAKAAVDGWLKGLRTQVTADKLDNSPEHREWLNNAARKVDEFNMYAKNMLGLGASGSKLDEIISDLKELVVTIYKYITGDEDEQRQRILLELDKLSWKDFDAL